MFLELIPDEPKMPNYVTASGSNSILDQLSHPRARGIYQSDGVLPQRRQELTQRRHELTQLRLELRQLRQILVQLTYIYILHLHLLLHCIIKKVKGKVFYGQEPPSGESTTTECGFNYQLLAVIC